MTQDWDGWLAGLDHGVTHRGHSAYLTIDTALEGVAWIEASGALVVGLEGFFLAPGVTRPSEEHIADFSELVGQSDGPAQSVAAARRLLEMWRGQIDAVEVVVDE
jgi:hypothetical protein